MGRRARQPNRPVGVGPSHLKLAAAHPDPDVSIRVAAEDRRRADRARAAAARKRLAGPPLPGALADVVSLDDLDELDIDAVGEDRVVLDERPELKRAYCRDSQVQEMLDTALMLVGLARSSSSDATAIE